MRLNIKNLKTFITNTFSGWLFEDDLGMTDEEIWEMLTDVFYTFVHALCIEANILFAVKLYRDDTEFYFNFISLHVPNMAVFMGFIVLNVLVFVRALVSRCFGKKDWLKCVYHLLPVIIVLTLNFLQYHPVITVLIAALWGIALLLFYGYMRNGRYRCERYRYTVRRYALFSFSVLLTVPCLLALFVYKLQPPVYNISNDSISVSIVLDIDDDTDTDLYIENIDLLFCFEEDAWMGYTSKEKVSYLQKLADLETEMLGMDGVEVYTEILDDTVLGEYDPVAKQIYIDTGCLSETITAERCIEVLCHEMFHAYQHYVVDHIDWSSGIANSAYFAQARAWYINGVCYQNPGTCNYEEYYNQPLEVDAREYASQETEKILSYIR